MHKRNIFKISAVSSFEYYVILSLLLCYLVVGIFHNSNNYYLEYFQNRFILRTFSPSRISTDAKLKAEKRNKMCLTCIFTQNTDYPGYVYILKTA